jgi:hypothetical protein
MIICKFGPSPHRVRTSSRNTRSSFSHAINDHLLEVKTCVDEIKTGARISTHTLTIVIIADCPEVKTGVDEIKTGARISTHALTVFIIANCPEVKTGVDEIKTRQIGALYFNSYLGCHRHCGLPRSRPSDYLGLAVPSRLRADSGQAMPGMARGEWKLVP